MRSVLFSCAVRVCMRQMQGARRRPQWLQGAVLERSMSDRSSFGLRRILLHFMMNAIGPRSPCGPLSVLLSSEHNLLVRFPFVLHFITLFRDHLTESPAKHRGVMGRWDETIC